MSETYARDMFGKGLEALERDQVFLALGCFEQARTLNGDPLYLSSLAFCIARTRNNYEEAIGLCRAAIAQDTGNPTHYLHLGRIYLLAGQKNMALKTFREGLKRGNDSRIVQELERLGSRSPSLFPSLDRRHPFNKYGGLLLSRLGFRG